MTESKNNENIQALQSHRYAYRRHKFARN